jgi:hypothetical protein
MALREPVIFLIGKGQARKEPLMPLGQHPLVRSLVRGVRKIVAHRGLRVAVLVAAVGLSLWNVDRVPHTAVLPAVVGLLPFAIGKYVLCPLRWHAISTSGRTRRWHLRAYAESEILGLISPWHAGADLWRVHRLETIGVRRSSAAAEVALDRFVGAIGLIAAVVITGVTLPASVIAIAAGAAAAVLLVALVVRRRRPGLTSRWPWPSPKVFAFGILLSVGYQATILGLLFASISAVGGSVPALQLVAIFGASQIAGVLPGVHGASPREGALVAGLASIGVSWTAAFGAVALTALLYWVPALLLGGSFLFLRWRGWFTEPHPETP